jgi:hypothetical protein
LPTTAKVACFRHSLHRPSCETTGQEWPLNFKFEINERTHYPAFAECVSCCIKRSEFCHTGKPESDFQGSIASASGRRLGPTLFRAGLSEYRISEFRQRFFKTFFEDRRFFRLPPWRRALAEPIPANRRGHLRTSALAAFGAARDEQTSQTRCGVNGFSKVFFNGLSGKEGPSRRRTRRAA